ncbi:MAG: hypothetical protein D6800_13400 [Candidatus Zixiibacteriota bacterium]|nr:MAG: hypothetical protein D6800_13400 [candidate division Zixibacteria bacterium]
MKRMIAIGAALVTIGVTVARAEKNPHGKLSWACADCHSTTSWDRLSEDMKFSHEKTGLRLDGAHEGVTCRSCHKELVFSHVGTACADCHSDHHQGQLGSDCAGCHTTKNWQPQVEVLQKHAERGFPLTGVHAVADCEACHRNSNRQEFTGTPTECEACHRTDLARATDPDHNALAFGTNCEQCHQAAFGGWHHTTYDHPASFPLTGAHAHINCSSCHGNTFAGTPTDCNSCHHANFLAAAEPNHVKAGFPVDCQTCHNTNGWQPAAFDHSLTSFPLDGRHASVDCVDCHKTTYSGTPADCNSCHQADYQATTDPNHAQAGFPVECQTCHNTSGWQPATFDHSLSSFPLDGRHATVNCTDCHKTTYSGTPSDCNSCHHSDYQATTDPNHAQAGFPVDCQTCHNTNGWQPATFDHSVSSFPLEGRHTTVNCVDCHKTSYTGTPTECYACHKSDYDGTSNPNHAASLFPTTCEQCHNPSGWSQTTWDHDGLYFPIYSGAHKRRWSDCTECHTVASNYAVFECTGCHAHRRTAMDDKHSGVRNYQYVSTACYDCHPRGKH